MQRTIGQKSSSSTEGDYQLATARPRWAEKMWRKIGVDNDMAEYEQRLTDHISEKFALSHFNQTQREAAYAHFLSQQITKYGGEAARIFREELDKRSAQTEAGMQAVKDAFGNDLSELSKEAGRAFNGLGEDINTLRSQTEHVVGDMLTQAATMAQNLESTQQAASQSAVRAAEHEAATLKLMEEMKKVQSEADAAKRDMEEQSKATVQASTATQELMYRVQRLANDMDTERGRNANNHTELVNANNATRNALAQQGQDITSMSEDLKFTRDAASGLADELTKLTTLIEELRAKSQADTQAQGATQQAANVALQEARQARLAAEAASQRQAQAQQQPAPPAQPAQPQLIQQANQFPPGFWDNLAGSISNGINNKKTDDDKEDLRSEQSDDDQETAQRRMEKRIKRLKFIPANERHFHAEAVLDLTPSKWIDGWQREFSNGRQVALSVGARNPPTAILDHTAKLDKLRTAASLFYESEGINQVHRAFKILRAECLEAMGDLLAHQSYSTRRESNRQALLDEIKKQCDTITRSTKTQKAVFLGEIYRKALKTEFQKNEDALKNKRKNQKAPWGREDSAAPTSTAAEPWRGKGGGRGLRPPNPI